MDHKAEAERLIALSCEERDAAWAQAWATQALVHATLAAIPAPIGLPKSPAQLWPGEIWPDPGLRIWCSTEHDVANEPVVVFQGDKVRAQRDLYAGEYLSNQDYA